MKTSDLNSRPSVANTTVERAGAVAQVAPQVAPASPRLRAPVTTRAPLGETHSARTSRGVNGQVQIRQARSAQGTRSKKLKEERIDELGRLEQASLAPLTEVLEGLLAEVRGEIGDISGRDAAEVRGAISEALGERWGDFATRTQQAIRGPRSTLTKRGLDAMRSSGADAFMIHVLVAGKLGMPMVRAEMQRLTSGIRGGALSVADVKKGLVTADGLLQRFCLAGVEVEHSYQGNGPRDLLLSFASSLHR